VKVIPCKESSPDPTAENAADAPKDGHATTWVPCPTTLPPTPIAVSDKVFAPDNTAVEEGEYKPGCNKIESPSTAFARIVARSSEVLTAMMDPSVRVI
jgi:hypothetical protein